MSKYDTFTVAECLAINEKCGFTFNVNDGHIISINFEEDAE